MEPDIGDRLRSEALKHPLVSIQGFSPPMSCTRGRLVKEPVSPAPAPEPPFPAPVPTPDTNKRLRNRNALQLIIIVEASRLAAVMPDRRGLRIFTEVGSVVDNKEFLESSFAENSFSMSFPVRKRGGGRD
jgi:hypothetical protein